MCDGHLNESDTTIRRRSPDKVPSAGISEDLGDTNQLKEPYGGGIKAWSTNAVKLPGQGIWRNSQGKSSGGSPAVQKSLIGT